MESACQVKGCKANKKVSKNIVHDDARAHKENNNVNCSDDENNDETNKKNTKKHTKTSSSTTTITPSTTSSSINNSNNNNNSNSVNKNIGYSSYNNKTVSNGKATTNDGSSIVNGSKTATSESSHNKTLSSYKTATSDLPYNKVVSNGKSYANEFSYDKYLSDLKARTTTLTAAATTTATTNNILSYNQVVINGKDSSNYLTFNKDTPNYISYNKIVSSSNKSGIDESLNNKLNISNISNSSSNISNSSSNNDSSSNDDAAKEASDKSLKSTVNTVSSGTVTTPVIAETPKQQQQQQQQPLKTNSESEQRRAVLTYEQVCRLNDVMNEVVSIHGRGNFPTLEVRLRDLVTVVKAKLEEDPSSGGAGMKVRDIRLNGGAASHVLATESQPYNDLDLIFGVEFGSSRNYDKVKAAVLSSLFDLLPEGVSRKRITTCSLKEAYVSKMVKVNNDGDRWSLISLGNSRGHRNVELKFVDTMRRQFEFSVDSFQIVLDSLLQFHASKADEATKTTTATTATTTTTTTNTTTTTTTELDENCYPNVVGESVYGDFHEALYHLQKKLISTRHPEEIRGGGLLKYCNLLVKMYKAAQPEYIKTLERYMCSRFFIDFPDISQQKAKLENYLWNHFVGPEEEVLKYQYLMLLHSVVEESTVCLMGHERRQTLALIESLAYQVLCQSQQRLTNHQAPPPAYVYANGYYYAPVIPTACYTCTCNSWMACSS